MSGSRVLQTLVTRLQKKISVTIPQEPDKENDGWGSTADSPTAAATEPVLASTKPAPNKIAASSVVAKLFEQKAGAIKPKAKPSGKKITVPDAVLKHFFPSPEPTQVAPSKTSSSAVTVSSDAKQFSSAPESSSAIATVPVITYVIEPVPQVVYSAPLEIIDSSGLSIKAVKDLEYDIFKQLDSILITLNEEIDKLNALKLSKDSEPIKNALTHDITTLRNGIADECKLILAERTTNSKCTAALTRAYQKISQIDMAYENAWKKTKQFKEKHLQFADALKVETSWKGTFKHLFNSSSKLDFFKSYLTDDPKKGKNSSPQKLIKNSIQTISDIMIHSLKMFDAVTSSTLRQS